MGVISKASLAAVFTSALSVSLAPDATQAHAASCISDFYAGRGGRSDTDQVLGFWNEGEGHAHLLCESGIVDGQLVRTTTEFQSGKVGFKNGWQSANPHGQVNLMLMNVNGASLDPDSGTGGSIDIDQDYESFKICGTGDGGDPYQFNDGMGVVNTVPGGSGAKITGYAFKNDATKTSILQGETLYSIDGSMLGCKLEVVVAIPVPSSGDLTFEVEFRVERDSREDEINAGLTVDDTDATELRILTEEATADSIRNGTSGTNTLLSMAKTLVCGANGNTISSPDVVIVNNHDLSFTYTAAAASVSGCGFVYWDPLMTPLGDGRVDAPPGDDDPDSAASRLHPLSTAAAAVGAAALLFHFA